MSDTALLRVQDLTTTFKIPGGVVRAVDHVSFELRRGETLGIVGESGSGKSMTALSILRLVQPPGEVQGGPISFNGRSDLLELSERDMRAIRGAEIGFIFQEPMTALNPVFTIGDQIAEALRVHRKATRPGRARKAVELLEAVQIPDPARRLRDYPHQLSGGMRQRVLIAIALACQPAAADRRRADHRPRRHDSGGDSRPAAGDEGKISSRAAAHHARPRRRRRARRSRRGDVCGPDRRTGADAPDLRLAETSLHAGAARLDSGRRAGAAPARDRRHRAQPRAAAAWLRVRAAVSERFERCPTAPPPAYEVGPDQRARCYLYDPSRA